MPANGNTVVRTANRLAVFRAVQRYMLRHRQTPLAHEIHALLERPMTEGALRRHLHALNGADGLPYPTFDRAREIEHRNGISQEHGNGRYAVDVLVGGSLPHNLLEREE